MSNTRPSAAERFFTKVDTTGDCWTWTTSKSQDGYGQFYAGNKKFLAHRWLYELFVGPVPEGLELDHLCRTPACVRPSHLEPVTHRENVLRGAGITAAHAAKTHCPQNHRYGPDSLTNRGHRRCPQCHREDGREYMRQKRAQDAAGKRQPCAECGLSVALKVDGTVRRHFGMTAAGFSTGESCPGVGKLPAAI